MVLLGAGNGSFSCTETYPLYAETTVAGDVDQDGKLDLVSSFLDGVAVFLNAR